MKLSSEMLRKHFSRFGEIVDCVVPQDPNTKLARGFGFITFAIGTAVDEVMNNRPHKVKPIRNHSHNFHIKDSWAYYRA